MSPPSVPGALAGLESVSRPAGGTPYHSVCRRMRIAASETKGSEVSSTSFKARFIASVISLGRYDSRLQRDRHHLAARAIHLARDTLTASGVPRHRVAPVVAGRPSPVAICGSERGRPAVDRTGRVSTRDRKQPQTVLRKTGCRASSGDRRRFRPRFVPVSASPCPPRQGIGSRAGTPATAEGTASARTAARLVDCRPVPRAPRWCRGESTLPAPGAELELPVLIADPGPVSREHLGVIDAHRWSLEPIPVLVQDLCRLVPLCQ